MQYRIAQALSKSFLIAAVLAFAGFHLLPGFESADRGWRVWPDDIIPSFIDQSILTADYSDRLVLFSFLTATLLIITSPFLGVVWIKSKLAWALVTSTAALAIGGFLITFLTFTQVKPGPAGWCLFSALFLNFFGLVLGRLHLPKTVGSPFENSI